MRNNNKKFSLRMPFYVTKRMNFSKKKYWAIRIGGIVLAFLMAAIVCTILAPGSFGTFFSEFFRGTFAVGVANPNSVSRIIVNLFVTFSLLLMISIVLTPAFKMRFWNIGAEGQILMGALAAAGVAKFCPEGMPNVAILILAMVTAMAASTVWATIPALCKAFFNTNETLFTLMMNYIATLAAAMAISIWIKNGSQSFGMLSQGTFPKILGSSGFLVIIFAIVIFIGMFFYINFGKSGYEVTVLGDSPDTARYIGMNIKAITIRTMAISGMLFGVIGFLIVCGVNRSFSSTIVAGKGFTGVLIAWLGHFDPLEIALFSFLSALMERGTTQAATSANISATQFSAICTGVFFFIIIACEFFSRYQIKIHHKEKEKEAIGNE